MIQIAYLTGDATVPQTAGPKIIAHICNDLGAWGKGFVLAISKRWLEPKRAYRAWYRQHETNDFALGEIQIVQVESNIWLANMIGQHGLRTSSKGVPIRYDAVSQCLEKLSVHAIGLEASVHLPRIGCGLAGGTWDKIEPLILSELSARDIAVFVYDLA
jgi:O-acetyl-ADP-ribose deacetylase (regulator of RNase III)